MNCATLRLDVIDGKQVSDVEEVIKNILQSVHSEKYLISLEQGDETGKLHFQGVVYYPGDKSYEWYKKKCEEVTKEWKGGRGKKNGARSFAQIKDIQQYSIYVTKDGDIRFRLGYSDDEVNDLKSKSYKKVPKKEKDKVVKMSNYNELANYCMQQMKDFDFKNIPLRGVAEEIAYYIQDYYLNNMKCEPNDFQLKAYVKSILKWMIYELDSSSDKKSYKKYLNYRAMEICGDSFMSSKNFFLNMSIKEDGLDS